MPAAAVIPTPRVSMMDAAVKKSVVVCAAKWRWLMTHVVQMIAERTGGVV